MRRMYGSNGSVGQVMIRSIMDAAIIIRGTSWVRILANTLASRVNIPKKDSPPFGGDSGGVEITQPETYSPQRFTELDGGRVARIEARPPVMAMEAGRERVARMEARPPVMAMEAGGGRVARMEARPRASPTDLIHKEENAPAVWIQIYHERTSLKGGQEMGTVMASGHPPLAASFIGLW